MNVHARRSDDQLFIIMSVYIHSKDCAKVSIIIIIIKKRNNNSKQYLQSIKNGEKLLLFSGIFYMRRRGREI